MRVRSTGWSGCGARNWTRTSPPLSEFLLVAVGRLGRGPEADLFTRYNDRLRPKLRVVEITEARGSPLEIKRREGAAVLAAIPPGALVVALDLGGKAIDSAKLATRLTAWTDSGR